jgi:hypothetical protein
LAESKNNNVKLTRKLTNRRKDPNGFVLIESVKAISVLKSIKFPKVI